MKKLTTLAMVALLAVAGAAFAGERFAGIEANATFAAGSPTTTNNDDSCDIAVTPAATLLLPYFEVDVTNTAGTGQTTLFAITNTSSNAQIAHVTVWTDWSFPILDFNIFLTGYDVQTINLYDVIVRGVVAPPSGTSYSNRTISPLGTYSRILNADESAYIPRPNPYWQGTVTGGSPSIGCNSLPGQLPPSLVSAVRAALTTGIYDLPGALGCSPTDAAERVGGVHANAIGYITIDVVNRCSTNLPDNTAYMTTELLFDNVFTGDYIQVDGTPTTGNYAQGSPMVHIRAVPEGGPAGAFATNLPFTFYERYGTNNVDRRQPLPSRFAARYIEGGASGFRTDMKVWREGFTSGTQACDTAFLNSTIPMTQIIRFDEQENPFTFGTGPVCSPCIDTTVPPSPETSRWSSSSGFFPQMTTGAVGGWMYMNLNNGGEYRPAGVLTRAYDPVADVPAGRQAAFGGATGRNVSQNWVIVSMFAEGRYAVDFDATWLDNGCSPAFGSTTTGINRGTAGNVTP